MYSALQTLMLVISALTERKFRLMFHFVVSSCLQTVFSPKRRVAGLSLVIAASIAGCGGGGYKPPAPSELTYNQTSISAVVGQTIAPDTPTVTGTVSAYAVSPALHAGLSLSTTTGVISGTPTTPAAASASYTVTATNAEGASTATLKIAVAAQIAAPSGLVYPQSTISATVNTAIAAETPSVTGTVTSYSVRPALPAGLTISSNAGTIAGTPTAVSSQAAYTVTASNSAGSTTATVQIAVAASAPTQSTFQYGYPSIGTSVGVPLTTDTNNFNLVGAPPTTFTVNPALPAGLFISSANGEIYGIPTAAAPSATYTVTATNSATAGTGTVQLTVTAQQVPNCCSYAQSTINAYVGEPISPDAGGYIIVAGEPAISISVSPALPAGLNLSRSTGTIAGTPTAVSPLLTYTISATNAAGTNSVTVQISVAALRAPTGIAYPQTSIVTYTGQAITPDIPGTSGGPVASYSVSPALPAGLSMNPSTGVISGTPTTSSPQTNYVVTGTNAAGHISSANTSITVTDPPMTLMHLGFSNGPLLFANGNVLSGNGGADGGPWTLWNYQTGAILASGDGGLGNTSVSFGYGSFYPYEANQMAGPTLALRIPGGIEVLSSADGHLLGTIASPGYAYSLQPLPNYPNTHLNEIDMWQLAPDGSYISLETLAGLYVYAPNGQLLFSKPGEYLEPATNVLISYDTATQGTFAAQGRVMVASGPAGPSAIENITVPDGVSIVASPYQGQYYQWFGDGSHFFSEYGYYSDTQQINPLPDAAVYVYTASSVLLGTQPQGIAAEGGWGNWVWCQCGGTGYHQPVSLYAIGSSSPALTYSNVDFESVTNSGSTLAILPVEKAMAVIDLSGSTPVETDYSLPPFCGKWRHQLSSWDLRRGVGRQVGPRFLCQWHPGWPDRGHKHSALHRRRSCNEHCRQHGPGCHREWQCADYLVRPFEHDSAGIGRSDNQLRRPLDGWQRDGCHIAERNVARHLLASVGYGHQHHFDSLYGRPELQSQLVRVWNYLRDR